MSNSGQLSAAVRKVIGQNQSIGYPPNRFLVMTQDGMAEDLTEQCEKLVRSQQAYAQIWEAIRKFPTLLTLEDEIVRSPDGLGLSAEVVELARERVNEFDKIRNQRASPRSKA